MQTGDLFFETRGGERIAHRAAEPAPRLEGWRSKCGRQIFRSRTALFHPMLPGKACAACGVTADDMRNTKIIGVQRG